MNTWYCIKTTVGEFVQNFGVEYGLVDSRPTMYEFEFDARSEIGLAFQSLKSRGIIRELIIVPVKSYR